MPTLSLFARLRLHASRYAYALAQPIVTLSGAVSQAEGDTGTKTFTYTITRTVTSGAVAVNWTFAAGTTSASDFSGGILPTGGTVNIADGQATGTFTVTTAGDVAVEADETFTVSIVAPPGYYLGVTSSATGTILNDDVTPGAARPDFSSTGLTPAFLFHPNTETGTTLAAGEVTAVAGMAGSPALQRGATGPLERTDALGRKVWSFRGSDYLEALPANFTSTPRAFTVVMVGRAHSSGLTINFFGHSRLSDGVTVDSITGAMLSTFGTLGSPNYIRSTGLSSYNAGATALANMVVGQQMQVFGAAGRTTANGGTRYVMNQIGVNHSQPQNANLDMKGFRLGGYEKANGTTNQFDLYCAVGFTGELTDAQVDAVAALLVNHYSIPAVTRQIVMEGDSITYGLNLTYERPGMQISGPGGFLPADVRVLDIAVSGSQVVVAANNLTSRRDAATAPWWGCLLPGGSANNLLYVQIGNNDFSVGQGNRTAAAVYPDFVAYLNTATTGVLQRGFNVAVGINIGSNVDATLRQRLLDWRVLLRAAQFDTDLGTNTGGAFAGRLARVELPLVQVGAAFPFESPPTGASTYFSDGTHPTAAGALLMVGGGDTPQYGIGSLF